MLGISYGQLFLLIGATAALIGPKELPIIARTVGRLAGRAIGYVQLARGQLGSVLQESQGNKELKELQETLAQYETILHEIRSASIMNLGPLTRSIPDKQERMTSGTSTNFPIKPDEEITQTTMPPKDHTSIYTSATGMHAQASGYSKLAELSKISINSPENDTNAVKLDGDDDSFPILPVSAESAGFLPNHKNNYQGSDIVLEAILEADVAHNAKHFFSQSQNQVQNEGS